MAVFELCRHFSGSIGSLLYPRWRVLDHHTAGAEQHGFRQADEGAGNATGAPTISGTPLVGQTLTAATSTIMDVDGLDNAEYTYQWIRVDSDGSSNPTNAGMDSSTYTLVAADEGKKLTVKVNFTDDDSNDEELTSEAYPANGTVMAAPPGEVEVESSWSLAPPGLSVGQKFRLIFATSVTRDAASKDIADYNTFVQNAAAGGHADIQDYSAGFRVVGSSRDVDARDNTGTTGGGVPIYWLNGNKVADDYADFYDSTWDDEVNTVDERGRSIDIATESENPVYRQQEHRNRTHHGEHVACIGSK